MPNLSDRISKICTPAHDSSMSELEVSFLTRRNKRILAAFSVVLVLDLIRFFLFYTDVQDHVPLLLGNLFSLLTFLLCCRSYTKTFSTLFLISNCLVPFSVFWFKDMAFMNLGLAVLLPIQVLYLTQDRRFFIFASSFFVFFINYINESFLMNAYLRANSYAIARKLSLASGSVVFMTTLFFLSTSLGPFKSKMKILNEQKILQGSHERLKTFIFSLSHELRNPLTAILGAISLSLKEEISPVLEEMLGNAKVSTEYLMQLLNNILDSGKSESESLEVKPVPTDIRDTTSKIWKITSELIKKKGLTSLLKFEKQVPKMLMIDPHRYCQILMNLLCNAVKFTDKGAINVNISWLPNRKVNEEAFEPKPYDDEGEALFEKNDHSYYLKTKESDDYDYLTSSKKNFRSGPFPQDYTTQTGVLKIIVRDTGCGISEKDRPKIFEKFSQVSADTKKRQAGSGLGLYITREIVEKMNGDIKVFSRLGFGTTFIALIPLVTAPVAQSEGSLGEKHAKVLLADSIPSDIDTFSKYLNQISGEALPPVNSAFEAYGSYVKVNDSGSNINVIILDIDLTVVNVAEFCRMIREYETKKKLKKCQIILVSKYFRPKGIQDLLDETGSCGAKFLQKPVTFEKFREAIS